jgi:hypothetical protein
MSLAGKAVMINWSNVAPQHRDEYYAWHDREHIAGRVSLPGFLRGRRHLAIDADRDIFNLYEVQDLRALTGEAYVAKTNNPSAATQATAAMITDAIRALAHVRYTAGIGVGAFVQTLRFDARPDGEASLEMFLTHDALPAITALPGVAGVHLCVADKAASSVVSKERKGRSTRIPTWSVIVEGVTVNAVRNAVSHHLVPSELARHGATDDYETGTYGLQIVMARADVRA